MDRKTYWALSDEEKLAHRKEMNRLAWHRRAREKGIPIFGSIEHREQQRKGMLGNQNRKGTGDSIGFVAIHGWLSANHPKTNICQKCKKHGRTQYAYLRHPEPYTRDIADYQELCVGCHVALDRRRDNKGRFTSEKAGTNARPREN